MPVLLEATVERTMAEPQGLGRLTRIAAEPGQRFADQEALDLVKIQVFQTWRSLRAALETQVRRLNQVALCQQRRALDGMVQLADIAGPEVLPQGVQRRRKRDWFSRCRFQKTRLQGGAVRSRGSSTGPPRVKW